MADKIQHARDTLTNWELYNPVLPSGMLVVVYDGANTRFKVGTSDGATQFNSTPYATGVDLSDYFNLTTNSADDIDEGSTNLFLTADERTIITYLTVTGAIDLDAVASKLDGIEAGAEVNNISDTNAGLLTGSADTVLHYHAEDRNRDNHTGTQLAATISDLDTAISANADVVDNTAKAHTQGTDAGTTENNFAVGDGTDTTDKYFTANTGVTYLPRIRYNVTESQWELSNDGVLFYAIENAAAGTTITGLDDTNISSPKGTQRLTYDPSQSKWINSDLIIVSKATSYSAAITDEVIICTATMTLTLPTAVGNAGKVFYIKTTTADTITVDTTSSQTIDGNLSVEVATQYAAFMVVSDGSNWHIF